MYEGRVREICNCGIRTLKHGFLHQTEEERVYYALQIGVVIKRRQGRNSRQQPGGTEVEVTEVLLTGYSFTLLNLLLYIIPGPPA